MNVRTMITTIAIGGICGLFVGSDTAQAVRVGGHAAVVPETLLGCTDMAYAELLNNCGTTKTYTYPLMVDGSGSKALGFRGLGDTSDNNVGCRGQAMNNNHTGYWATPWVYMSQFGSVQDVSVGSLNVGADGAAYMRCQVDDGARLLTIEWEQ